MTLRLNGSTSGYVEIDAPATAGSNTLVLPTGNGTNGQYLQTNGSGSLSWATVAGGLLQTQQTVLTATNSFSTSSSGAWYDIPSLTVSITTTAANSKIVVNAFVFGEHTDNEADKSFKIVRTIGGTSVDLGAPAAGSRPAVWSTMTTGWNSAENAATPSGTPLNNYLDSPAQTSGTSITYKVQVWSKNVGSTFFLNRCVADDDNTLNERGWSYINLMEVAV